MMETTDSREPSSQPYTPKKVPQLLKIALITGALSAIVSGFIMWQGYQGGSFLRNQPDHLLFQARSLPVFPVTIYDVRKKTLEQLTAKGQGTASILGYAAGPDHEYYLLSEESGKYSNVYAVDKKKPEAGMTQLSHSKTMKLGLSFDAATHQIVYTAFGSGTTSSITLLRQGTSTEHVLAKGKSATILKGGFFVVYEQEGNVYTVGTVDGIVKPLLTIPQHGTYAIDPTTLTAVMYNPSNNELQHFSISTSATANYLNSEKALTAEGEHALVLSGDAVLELVRVENGLLVAHKSKLLPIPDSGMLKESLISFYEH